MSAQGTASMFASPDFSAGCGQAVGQSKGGVSSNEAFNFRSDSNLEVEIAMQAKANGDITLSLLCTNFHMLERSQPGCRSFSEMGSPCVSCHEC